MAEPPPIAAPAAMADVPRANTVGTPADVAGATRPAYRRMNTAPIVAAPSPAGTVRMYAHPGSPLALRPVLHQQMAATPSGGRCYMSPRSPVSSGSSAGVVAVARQLPPKTLVILPARAVCSGCRSPRATGT